VHRLPTPYSILIAPKLRSLVFLAALALSLISVQGADAELKSEWKFGGSLTHTLLALPIASAMLGNIGAFDEPLMPSATQPTGGSLEGLFSRRGLVGGFAAGFLGAGVFGVVFGHGMYGELNGITSMLGLVFQLTLLVLLVRLIWGWWRADQAAALAGLSPRELADAYGRARRTAVPDIDVSSSAEESGGEARDAANRPI
jgi:hypothetical protein